MRISVTNISLRALCLLPALALGACDPKLKVGEILDEDAPADSSSTGDDAPADSDSSSSTGDDAPADSSGSTSGEPAPDDTTTDVSDSDSTGAPDDDTGEPAVSCDPLLQVCPGGEDLCIHDGTDFICVVDASGEEGQVFDPCEYLNVCDMGLACVPSNLAAECDPVTDHCCLPFCDLSKPNECPGAGQECVSFFGDEPAPAGQENVGLCSLPG